MYASDQLEQLARAENDLAPCDFRIGLQETLIANLARAGHDTQSEKRTLSLMRRMQRTHQAARGEMLSALYPDATKAVPILSGRA